MKRLTVGSLFSGIGGFELGLSNAALPDGSGFDIGWQVEIEPYALRVLAKHWPDVPRWEDVRTFPPDPVEDWAVDLVCGGFPCQSISSAGKKLGKDDERYLWPEMARVCQVLRPRWVVAENVARIISASDELGNRGSILGDVLRDLAALGYDAEWHCIPASSFGALHRRDRFWLVAWMADAGHWSKRERTRAEGDLKEPEAPERTEPRVCRKDVSDAARVGEQVRRGVRQGGEDVDDVPDPVSERGRRRYSRRDDAVHVDPCRQIVGPGGDCGWWAVEPELGRVAHGVPSRLDRLRGLGNAVVPQIITHLGQAILEVEAAQ